MKKSEARQIIDKAVSKAMGAPVEKDWITINGTHVFVGDDGEVEYGPSGLKDGGTGSGAKSGGSKGSSGKGSSGKSGSGKNSNGKSGKNKDPFKNSYEIKGKVDNLYSYLKNTKETDLYGRTTYFNGGWHDNEFDANQAGFNIERMQNPEYQANHTFSEVYHFTKKK